MIDLLEHITQVRRGERFLHTGERMLDYYDPAGLDEAERLLRSGDHTGGLAALKKAHRTEAALQSEEGFKEHVQAAFRRA